MISSLSKLQSSPMSDAHITLHKCI